MPAGVCVKAQVQQCSFAMFVVSPSIDVCLSWLPAGNLPSYAAHYLQQIGSLPWRQPLTDPTTVPWLSHLAPEAKGSLYEFGRYLLSLTAAGKKGHVTSEQYDMCFDAAHLLDSIAGDQASVAEMLIEACAAFAHSPLAMVVDPRAAVQCVMRTVRRVLGTHGITVITPSVVEQEVQHVCAAGCGKEVGAEGVCFADMGESVVYSCHECAASVSDTHMQTHTHTHTHTDHTHTHTHMHAWTHTGLRGSMCFAYGARVFSLACACTCIAYLTYVYLSACLQHRSALQPEQLIYMCWPFNHVDALYVNTVMQRHREGAWELCGSLSCTEETTCAGECIGCVLQPSVQQQCPQFCSHGLASAQGCCSAPSPSTIGKHDACTLQHVLHINAMKFACHVVYSSSAQCMVVQLHTM